MKITIINDNLVTEWAKKFFGHLTPECAKQCVLAALKHRKTLAVIAATTLTLTARADSNPTYRHVWEDAESMTASDSVTNALGAFTEFLSNATTNLIIIPYGIASTDFKKYGGGVAIGYEMSPNVVPFVRLENYNGDFFMPSGTVQLQVPFHIGSFTVIPFAYTGVAVPLGSHSSDPVVGIVGTGGAIRLGSKFDLIAAYEMRSSTGNQICLGIGWKPNGW